MKKDLSFKEFEEAFGLFASHSTPLTKEQAQYATKALASFLEQKFHVTPEQLNTFLTEKQAQAKEAHIPVSIFKTTKISSLETIVKYFHENKQWRFVDIAKATNRDPRAISTTYRNAKRKHPQKMLETSSQYHIPLSIFCDKTLSILEHIAHYLATQYRLKLVDIAKLLKKDQRTIWTVIHRAKKKLEKENVRARGGSFK